MNEFLKTNPGTHVEIELGPVPVTVWVVSYDCGDYYHDGEHLVGVFATEADAKEATVKHDKSRNPQEFYYNRYEYAVYSLTVGKVMT